MPLYNPNVIIQDESVNQGVVKTINFAGAGVSSSVTGTTATVNIAGGGGPGGSGVAGSGTVDFGAFPGSTYATTVVTGQTDITGTSVLNVWVFPATTADHTPDDHLVDPPIFIAGDIVAGVGFTVHAFAGENPGAGPFASGTMCHGLWSFQWKWE